MSQNSFNLTHMIPFDNVQNKKWHFLQYVYRLWQDKEFITEPLKIHESRTELTHSIYTGISEMEFILYIYFTEINDIVLRGRNADCIITYEDGKISLTYFDKFLKDNMELIFKRLENMDFSEEPQFDFKMYFYVPEYGSEFYYQFISYVYYLSEIDVKKHGLKICDRKGKFQSYNSLDFPHDNLDKFLYYDGNIFIGSHSQNNMIIVFNLPKAKLLELRRWCNEYKN